MVATSTPRPLITTEWKFDPAMTFVTCRTHWAKAETLAKSRLTLLQKVTQMHAPRFLHLLDDLIAFAKLNHVQAELWASNHPVDDMRNQAQKASTSFEGLSGRIVSSPALGRILENLKANDLDEKGRRFLTTAKRDARLSDEKATELDLEQAESGARPPMDDAAAERACKDVYSLAPQNEQIIQRMLELRHKRAQSLGYANFAGYALESDTLVDPKTFRKDLAKASERLVPLVEREMAALSQAMESQGTKLTPWNVQLTTKLLVRQQYPDFDRVAANKVLPHDTVISGIFRFISELFSLDFRKVSGAKAWHPSVQVYDVFDTHHDDDSAPSSPSDNAHLLGRFYLDPVQRPDKCRDLRTSPVFPSVPEWGLLPAVCLVGSLVPSPETSYFDLANVASLLEESGHSVHFLLAQQSQSYHFNACGGTEFGGILSQLLREMSGKEAVMKRIVKDDEAIKVLRPVLEERALGSNMLLRTQILDHIIFLDLHENVDIDGHFSGKTRKLVSRLHHLYGNFGYMRGTQMQHSFASLSDNDCRYYTDVRISMFAKQLAQRFLDTPTGEWSFLGCEFRKAVLEPGLSEDANELLRNFLRAKCGKRIMSWLKR